MRDILKRTATDERIRALLFVLLMSLAGLVSGVLTAALCDVHFSDGLGIPFGVTVALCLGVTGVTRSILRLAILPVLFGCTFVFSVFLTEILELMAGERFVGTVEKNHLIALFIGGMVGGFIVIRGSRILSKSEMTLTALAWDSFWSIMVGALSPIGWELGPSLGMWLWSGLHAAGVTSPTNTFSNALSGETGSGPASRLYALFVVWQTGMGFALGMTLRNIREKREPSSLQELKLS
ncbi:MAG: hypothetical protein ACRD3P_18190 [Terriglobales bacterium]